MSLGAGKDASPWFVLDTADVITRGEFRVLETHVQVFGGRVLYAVDNRRLRCLLVPLAEGASAGSDFRSAGVHLYPRELEDGSRLSPFLVLACQKPHLNQVFTHVVAEVLEEIEARSGSPEAACRMALARWRQLIDQETASVLSVEALAGLFGELLHLRRIVTINPSGLQAWKGPLGHQHDFARENCALEVKTSLAREQWIFEVHGIEQLAPPTGGELFLSAMRLRCGDSGEDLPTLVGAVAERVDSRRDFMVLLRKAGYDPRDDAHYRAIRFDVSSVRLFRVEGDFPRITVAVFDGHAVPKGVLRLRYSVDLAHASDVKVPGVLEDLYSSLAGRS